MPARRPRTSQSGTDLANTAHVSQRTLALKETGIKIEMIFQKLGVVATLVALIVVIAFALARAHWPQLDD
jgi:hypothetical protein